MNRKAAVSFRKSETPVSGAVTKFGGQPAWIEKPEWAISRSTGKQMRFICQIALDSQIFGSIESRMAYIFMTDDFEEYVDGTWEADGGENAVIIQPNGNNAPFAALETGPTIYEMKPVEGEYMLKPFACEFVVDLNFGEDADEAAQETPNEAMSEIKIGGTPVFLQNEEYPTGNRDDWQLLLQMDSCSVPFDINFGDAGVGYAFISRDGKTGKFLWQCA